MHISSMIINKEAIIVSVILLSVIILATLVLLLQRRISKLLIGKSDNIEESISLIVNELEKIKEFKAVSEDRFKEIEKDLKKSIQSVETIRFNPFKGTGVGGNQSFATAFINKEGKGVVLSSLHSRERVSVFSKPIEKYSSEYELSDEERESINKAKENL